MFDKAAFIKELVARKEASFSCMEKDESSYIDAETYGTESPNTMKLRYLGYFAKEIGESLSDYELIGIGQSLIDHAEKLDLPYSNVIHGPE